MAGSLGSSAFNLAVLVTILAYYLKNPLRGFVAGRHQGISEELKRVAEQLRISQERFEEFSSKLKALDAEVSSLHGQAKQDAAAVKNRILAEAQRLADVITADARANRDTLYAELQLQLRTQLGEKVLARAEAILRERLTGDDRQRLRQEFSSQVERSQ